MIDFYLHLHEYDHQENIDDEVSIGDGSDDEASDEVSEMNVSLHIKQDLKDSNEEEPEVIAGSDETKLEDITDPKTQDLPPGPGQVGTSVEDDENDIEIQNAELEDSTESDDVNEKVETPETPDSSDCMYNLHFVNQQKKTLLYFSILIYYIFVTLNLSNKSTLPPYHDLD